LFFQELFTPNQRSGMVLKSMFYLEEAVPVRPDDAVRTQRALTAALRSLSDSTFVQITAVWTGQITGFEDLRLTQDLGRAGWATHWHGSAGKTRDIGLAPRVAATCVVSADDAVRRLDHVRPVLDAPFERLEVRSAAADQHDTRWSIGSEGDMDCVVVEACGRDESQVRSLVEELVEAVSQVA